MTRHQRLLAPDPRASTLSAREQAVIHEARQILLRHLNHNQVLSSWKALLDYCALTIRGEVERFHVLYLDRKNRLISDECLSVGTVDRGAPRKLDTDVSSNLLSADLRHEGDRR